MYRLKKIRRRRRQILLLHGLLRLTDKAKATSKAKRERKRRDPDVLIQESLNDGLFEREYRMGINALKKLLDRHNSTSLPSATD
jgi:hypothetical protein